MPKTIPFHSFRRGTGKSSIIANVAYLLATQGVRVGVIETDLKSPGSSILFNVDATQIEKTWTDFLWGKASAQEIGYDVTPSGEQFKQGKLFLVPSGIEISSISQTLHKGFEIKRINEGFIDITEAYNLDALLVDTYAGISEEAMMSLAVADMLFAVMRLDQQDHQGTGILLDISRQLGIKNLSLLLNDISPVHNPDLIRKQIRESYNCEIAAILPHSPQMLNLSGRGVFVDQYPVHPLTDAYRNIARQIKSEVEKDKR